MNTVESVVGIHFHQQLPVLGHGFCVQTWGLSRSLGRSEQKLVQLFTSPRGRAEGHSDWTHSGFHLVLYFVSLHFPLNPHNKDLCKSSHQESNQGRHNDKFGLTPTHKGTHVHVCPRKHALTGSSNCVDRVQDHLGRGAQWQFFLRGIGLWASLCGGVLNKLTDVKKTRSTVGGPIPQAGSYELHKSGNSAEHKQVSI